MYGFIVENKWNYADYGIHAGWGNGYVVIPPDHPLWGKSYDELNEHIDIHGGLTYASFVFMNGHWWEEIPHTVNPEGWVVGFDTNHYEDTLELWPKEAVILETSRLMGQLMKFKLNYDEKILLL
jgi:hypothetical protein